MTVHNFTASDLTGSLVAVCLFPLVVLIPGYVLAWLADLLSFRTRSTPFRVALSIPLSISLCPILTYLTGRFAPPGAIWAMYGAIWLAFLVLLVAVRLPPTFPRRAMPWLIGLGWVMLVLLSLLDLQLGRRLYYSTIALDYSVRSALTDAITVTGIPPQNPFFHSAPPVLLRYHYFWLILCSLVDRLGGAVVSPRQAIIGGTVWIGFATMALIGLYARLFAPAGSARLRRRSTLGILLLGVTGLDILPTLLLALLYSKGLGGAIFPSLEWWNDQVDGWIYTILWEPHHMSGLIACLTGFLFLWYVPEEPGRRGVLKNGMVAGLALATAVGASIYVAFVFAIFLLAWTAIAMWKGWRREIAALLLAGLSGTLFILPYLRGLLGPGAGGPPFQPVVRAFLIPDMIFRAMGLGWWQLAIADLVLLPLNYFLELGFFFAAGWLQWRRWKARGSALSRYELASVTMLVSSVLICTFLRSSVIGNNDLGWRGFLVAQFVLLLWSADLLADWHTIASRRLRATLTVLLVLGAAGTIYDLAILRCYPLLSDGGAVRPVPWMTPDRQLGKRTYASREAYEWVQAHTAADVVVQQNPDVSIQDTAFGLYSNRASAAFNSHCGAEFGGDPGVCAPVVERLRGLYSPAAAGVTPGVDAVCRELSLDLVVARDVDQAWSDRASWVWLERPVFANEYLRIFACPAGGSAGGGRWFGYRTPGAKLP